MSGSALRVTRVTVGVAHVEVTLLVRLDVRRTRVVPREQVDALFEALPGLRHHRCGNPAATAFFDESFDTETAHLFEHVVLEIMAEAGSVRDLAGVTAWDAVRDGPGAFRISVEYDHDLVCLGAVKLAVVTLDRVLSGAPVGDLSAEILRLRSLRAQPVRSAREAFGTNTE